MITKLDATYGRDARSRLAESTNQGPPGARAALETFYHAFNRRLPELFREIWMADPLIQLNNPLGGILRGHEPIVALYDRIFNGPATVWVEFFDIVEYAGRDTVVFAGRERGEFTKGTVTVPLAIRTTRIFSYAGGSWRQAHHHGSIDDPELLARYQAAVTA